ncbi:MAG TPA: Crp/Fnr family transcriptional regulator [Candidatus Acidoferrales bacterium]|nr:Crp/Fnr family transcriptional regulator [Candidatus Acidoferrales bacterium]
MSERSRTDEHDNAVRNCMLASIPDEEFEELRANLSYVRMSVGENLHMPKDGIRWAYFVNSGMVSLLVGMKGGKTVEVGVAGYEGMTGVTLAAGLKHTTHMAVTEVAGDAFRIEAEALEEAFKRAPELLQRANRFGAIQGMQVAQTAACNRLHDVSQRMARWLLMTDDRVREKTLHVTHDFLSMMLGTDRPTVTAGAIELQESGVIEYSRGKLRILDRKKLEAAACECYWAIQRFNAELGLN